MRLAPENVATDPDPAQQFDHPLLPFGRVQLRVDPQGFAHDFKDALTRVERGIRVLEDHLHSLAFAP